MATPMPLLTMVMSTNAIRTVVTLKPFHSATPAATPPPSRSGRLFAPENLSVVS